MTDPRKLLGLSVVLLLGAAVLVGTSIRPTFLSTLDPGSAGVTRTHPFQRKLDFTVSANPSFSVPVDKRLGLTYAAAKVTTSSGQQPLVCGRQRKVAPTVGRLSSDGCEPIVRFSPRKRIKVTRP